MVTVGSTSQYAFHVSDDNNFNVTVGSTLPQKGRLVQEGDTFTFTWNVTSINEANITLTFIATDNLGATSFLRPQLLICPCKNSGNCTTEGLSGAADNPLVMNCLCDPGLCKAQHVHSILMFRYCCSHHVLSMEWAFL